MNRDSPRSYTERIPLQREAWLCLFVLAWAVLAASTPLAKIQIDYLKTPAVLQIAVPVMGIVGGLVIRELARRPSTANAGNPHPRMASA